MQHSTNRPIGKKKYDVILLYESKVRELDSVVLLSAELKRRGFTTKVVNTFSYQVKRQKKIEAKVIVVPFLYDDLEIYEYIYRLCGKVEYIVNLRWEQIYSEQDEQDMNYFAYPKNNARKALHISWSEYLTALLIKSGVNKTDILTSGPIHMDFLREEFRAYFMSRRDIAAKYCLPLDYKWKLFVSSFSYTTLGKEELRRYEQTVSAETYEFLEVQCKSKAEILQWFEHSLQRDKEAIIIYRPHPAERNDTILEQMEKQYENFRVIREEAFRQWLVVVDEVYNWRSTCIADAYFCNKTSYILRPFPLKASRELPLMKGIKAVEKEEDFHRLGEGESDSAKIDYRIEQYYNRTDKPAFMTICDRIERILSERQCKQDIDYDVLLHSISFKQKVKETRGYFLYIRTILFLHQKGFSFSKKLNKKANVFINNIRNIVPDQEILKMENKMHVILERQNIEEDMH